jgi:hypothetical protein
MPLTVIDGTVTDVHTTARHKAGQRYEDESGNVFVYMAGATSVAAGSWCAMELDASDLPIVELLDETIGVGRVSVCVAKAAISASTYYGWFQVVGVVEGKVLISDAANAVQYCTTTAGSLDDTGTTKVAGVRLVDTAAAAGLATFYINYPCTA